jgi:hypothetical protein
LHAEDRRGELGELCHDDFCFAEMYYSLIVCFLQPEVEEDPEGDGADKDVDIIGDDMQTGIEETKRHAEAEMPATEVPTADIPIKAEIPH